MASPHPSSDEPRRLTTLSMWTRFAYQYSPIQLLIEVGARTAFLHDVAFAEGQFHQDGVGINAACGHTYDGHMIDYESGRCG